MQATHPAFGGDLAARARGAGSADAATVWDESALDTAATALLGAPGPVFVAIKVTPAETPMVLPPRDGEVLKNRFRTALEL